MDFLSHLFVPLIAVYVLRPRLFDDPAAFAIAAFGLLSDGDKFLGVPGLLHSVLTLVPLCAGILLVERWWSDRLRWAPIIVAVIVSHLVLDFVDGGPVPLLFPLVESGIGLQYPVRTVFGASPLGVGLDGPIVTLRTAVPRSGFNTYGFVSGAGVASALLFLTIYIGDRIRGRR